MKKITILATACLLTMFFSEINSVKAQTKKVKVIVTDSDDKNDKTQKEKTVKVEKEIIITDDDSKDGKEKKTKKVIIIKDSEKGSKNEQINISINGKDLNIDENMDDLEKSLESVFDEMHVIAKEFGCELDNNFNFNFSMNDEEITMNINGKTEKIKISEGNGKDDKDNKRIIERKVTRNGNGNIDDTDRIVTVFPNPSSGKVSVKFNLEKAEDATVLVMDMNGKQLHTESFKNVKSETKELDLTKLAKGNYMLTVKMKNDMVKQTIVLE